MRKANLGDISRLPEEGIEWPVDISYSSCSPLPTGNEDYCLSNGEDSRILWHAINEFIALRKRDNQIANPEAMPLNTLRLPEQRYRPDCRAAVRSLIVMPDGSVVPCSIHRRK